MADKDKGMKKVEKKSKRSTTKEKFLTDKNDGIDVATKKEHSSTTKPVFPHSEEGVPETARDPSEFEKTPAQKQKLNLSNWLLTALTTKQYRKICREFFENKKIKPTQFTLDAYNKNDAKNRYADILCMDATRVVLKDRPSDQDYIHASWMKMPNDQKYISTQGPLSETVEDFWHMIYTEKCIVIVMVCNYTEHDCEKCAQYYSLKGNMEKFGPYKVQMLRKEPDPADQIKHTLVMLEVGGEKRTIHHLANHHWTDHVAPETPQSTITMHRLAKRLSQGFPITVHCSAGIGRTATFIGIDYAHQKIQVNPDITMVDVLRDLRFMRFHSIQSPMQYVFLYICVIELIVQDDTALKDAKYDALLYAHAQSTKKYIGQMQKKEAAKQ